MKFKTRLLIESYKLIYRYIRQGGNLWINRSIQKNVKWLYHRYGITRKEIIEFLKWRFKSQKWHHKFNPNRSCLNTYVLNFCYYGILSLVRECKKHDAGINHIPLSQNPKGDKISPIGRSYESYEQRGSADLVDSNTPEELLIGKELMQMALDFFGKEDLEVLLGVKDRETEAERLGISYDAFLKRLNRKRARFQSILKKTDYLD